MSTECIMVKSIKLIGALIGLFLSTKVLAVALPAQPTNPADPGSASYRFNEVKRVPLTFNNQNGALYVPVMPGDAPLVLIAFAHGHVVPEIAYGAMYEHLARKGFAVLFIPYDQVADTRDFKVMAEVYQTWVEKVVTAYPTVLSSRRVIYSGHSKGALVASLAASLSSQPNRLVPHALVVFGLAGASPEQQKIPKKTIITLVVGDQDNNTKPATSEKAFKLMRTEKKQLILVSSYVGFQPEMIASHGSFRTLGLLGNQVGPLHWFSYWKFLVSAAWDIEKQGNGTDPWLYGPGAFQTGTSLVNHITRVGF